MPLEYNKFYHPESGCMLFPCPNPDCQVLNDADAEQCGTCQHQFVVGETDVHEAECRAYGDINCSCQCEDCRAARGE